MQERYFPSTACVLACSGPSLNTVDVFSLGLPVVAVSTSIRTLHKPDYWVLADYVNEMHGEQGKIAYADPSIVKVVPSNKVSENIEHNSMVLCEYDTSTRWPNIDQLLFTGKQPFLRGPHKSVTFAIQWLHYIGVKTVIWAGNDLTATSMTEKYCYEVKDYDMKKEYNYQKTLDHTAEALSKWYPVAKNRGFSWYSWNCGEVFEKIVPKFNLDSWNKTKEFANPSAQLKLEVDNNSLIVKKNERTEVREKRKKNEIVTIHNTPRPKKIQAPSPVKDTFVPPHTILNPEPAQEIVSERRQHMRNAIKIRKNLRSR